MCCEFCWWISIVVIRNSVVVEKLWLIMYSVELDWFGEVIVKMFSMMKLKCEMDV